MIIAPGVFNFSKILIFLIVRGIKGQKMLENEKKLSVWLHIAGTIHLMFVIYGVHV